MRRRRYRFWRGTKKKKAHIDPGLPIAVRRFGLAVRPLLGSVKKMFYELEADPGSETPKIVRMVVEIPRDSSNKYEFDPSLKLFKLARTLYSPLHYPGDYGFIPGTIAEDNEPLDILCLVNSPSFTGCLTYVRPLAVLEMVDGNSLDHKILAVPGRDPRHNETRELNDVSEHIQREIVHFFSIYKELEGKTMVMKGWQGITEAYSVVNESRERYLSVKPAGALL